MARYDELILELTGITQRPVSGAVAQLAPLANEYAEFCQEANARLLDIKQLLAKGLRSVAVERAKTEPDLLEMVMTLDFYMLPRWNELCVQHNLTEAPMLLIEVATDLNEAYAAELPLAGLMREHRLLALARNPLFQRLIILRRIAALDSNNPAWIEDLKAYEQARVRELTEHLDQAYKEKNIAYLAEMHREVNHEGWSIMVPVELKQKAAKFHKTLRRENLIAQLSLLGEKTHASWMQNDLETMGQLLENASQIMAQINPPAPEELLDLFTDPRHAYQEYQSDIEDDQKFEISISELEHLLDEDLEEWKISSYRDALERQIVLVEAYARTIPEHVFNRARAKLQRCEKLEKRAHTSKLIAMVFSAFALIAIVGGAFWFYQQNVEKTTLVAEMNSLFDQRQFDKVVERFNQLASEGSSFTALPEVRSLHDRSVVGAQEQKEKTQRLDFLLEGFVDADVSALKLEELDEADSLAADLGQGSAATEVLKYKKRRETWLLEEETARRQNYQTNHTLITSELQQFQLSTDLVTEESVQALELKLSKLSSEFNDIANVDLIQSQRAAIDELKEMMSERSEFQSRTTLVFNNIGNTSSFDRTLDELRDFIRDRDEYSILDSELKQISMERDLRDGLLKWSQFYSQQCDLSTLLGVKIDNAAQRANNILTEASEMFQEYPVKSVYNGLEVHLAQLRTIADRDVSAIRLLKQDINAYLEGIEGCMKTREDGRDIFYWLPQGDLSWEDANTINSSRIAKVECYQNNGKTSSLFQIEIADLQYYGVSPHSVLKSSLFPVIDQLESTSTPWEYVIVEAIELVLDNEIYQLKSRGPSSANGISNIRLPEVTRLEILKLLLRFGNQQSAVFNSNAEDGGDLLTAVDYDIAIDFWKPTTIEASLAHKRAAEAIGEFAKMLEQLSNGLRSGLKNFVDFDNREFVWTGIVWNIAQDGTNYTLRLRPNSIQDGNVYVIVPTVGVGLGSSIELLGAMKKGRLVLKANNNASRFPHRSGRPIFMRALDREE